MSDKQPDPVDVALKQVDLGKAAVFNLVEELGKGGGEGPKTLRVEHTELPPIKPVRAESGARTHTFNSVDDLSAYLIKYGTQNQVVLAIDLPNKRIEACLDEKAKEGVEILTYQPRFTRAWESFLKLLDGRLQARQFSKTIRELAPYIVEPDQATVRHLAGQLAVAKEVEDLSSTGTKGSFGRIVKIKARAGDGQPFEVPEKLKVAVKPYVDTPEPVEFEVFVDLLPCDEKNVAFELDCPDAAHVFEAAMLARRERLEEELKVIEPLICFGALGRERWSYLK